MQSIRKRCIHDQRSLAALAAALFIGGQAEVSAQAPTTPAEQRLPVVEVRGEVERGYAPRPSGTATGLEPSPAGQR